MPLSALALKGWAKKVPPVSWPPITHDLTALIAVVFAFMGKAPYGVATLLASECHLRVGELTQLRCSHVALAGDEHIMGSQFVGGALRIRKAKTGKNQWATVRDPVVVELLKRYLRDRMAVVGAEGLLFPFKSAT